MNSNSDNFLNQSYQSSLSQINRYKELEKMIEKGIIERTSNDCYNVIDKDQFEKMMENN